MMSVGQRLMLLGALVLGGTAIYFMVDQPSQAELDADNFIRELHNEQIRLGAKTGKIEYQTAEEKLGARRSKALWPAGLGLMLLGVGWAVAAGGKAPEDKEGIRDG